jgi:hypothetical protein
MSEMKTVSVPRELLIRALINVPILYIGEMRGTATIGVRTTSSGPSSNAWPSTSAPWPSYWPSWMPRRTLPD